MNRAETIRVLNELYAEEIEAAVRYLHLSATVKGLDRLLVRKHLLEGLEETLEHAQTVAEKILQLGGAPRLDLRIQLPAERTTASDAIRTALTFEQGALEAYGELLNKVTGDVALEEFARAQIELESRHVASLQLLIEG
jgi:bacterioferritin